MQTFKRPPSGDPYIHLLAAIIECARDDAEKTFGKCGPAHAYSPRNAIRRRERDAQQQRQREALEAFLAAIEDAKNEYAPFFAERRPTAVRVLARQSYR